MTTQPTPLPPKWYRVRFKANLDDSRPIKWPPPGPFWESGFNDEHATVVAFVTSVDQVAEFWPESNGETDFVQPCERIEFSDRFDCPDYWDAEKECMR